MSTNVPKELSPSGAEFRNRRWFQLTVALVAMMAISSPQYVWTLFEKPLQATMNSSLPAIQVTFSVLIVVQTWLSPLQGFWIERFGVRTLFSIGAVLVGASWVLGTYALTPMQPYLTYGLLGGLGTGIVDIGIVGLMVKGSPIGAVSLRAWSPPATDSARSCLPSLWIRRSKQAAMKVH